MAKIATESNSKTENKMRKCLGGCEKRFRSKGPGDRICKKCKKGNKRKTCKGRCVSTRIRNGGRTTLSKNHYDN